MIRTCFIALLCLLGLQLGAQQTFPVNGPADTRPRCDAFVHVTLVINYKTIVNDATLLIRNGRVEAAGTGITPPADAIVHDMRGRWIYPSFIDLYSNYGISYNTDKKANRSGQQFLSLKKGAYGWNEAIRPELDAANLFSSDTKKAAQLREAGFGLVVTGLQDGICRGTSALVATGDGSDNDMLMMSPVAAGFSFSKGSSTQDYPSSLMGSIALLRQTYYDAAWYHTQSEEKDLSLEAFTKLRQLPAIFAADNKLNVLRADKVGDEFGITYIVKGAGDEYQRVKEIAAAGVPLIIPLNFPRPFDVEDPFDADNISTTDLRHWEMAPYNAAVLESNNIRFSFTYNGCERAADFLKNLRKAVQKGLPETAALKALTETPAQLLRLESLAGSLQKGMPAHFFIATGNIFNDDAYITELWIAGKKNRVSDDKPARLEGNYRISMEGYEQAVLSATWNQGKNTIMLQHNDTVKAVLNGPDNLYLLTFKPKAQTNSIRVSMWPVRTDSFTYPARITALEGRATFADGHSGVFTAQWTGGGADTSHKAAAEATPMASITYPFTDYGDSIQPAEETILFRNATVWTNEKEGILTQADVAVSKGRIIAVGRQLSLKGAREIDARGRHLTSGIIDEHSHIAISNGVNEGTQAVTSEVRIGDVINSEDVNIYRQLSGGVTACQLLHGSANPIGGQSALIKLRWGLEPSQMKIAQADGFIKFALGENVKQSNWGDRAVTRYPQTRMGVEQVMTDAFTRAREYQAKHKSKNTLRTDLELEALVEILDKKRFITCHSYVQSEINMLMHVADSFHFRVNTFTHILEGYKVADKMKQHGVNAATFADWWAYKLEVAEAIPYNASILHKMGVNTAINSDDAEMGRRLNQEAAKIVKYGGISEEDAWKMVTLNPAKALHLDKTMGSIAPGKDADLVLWSDNPLSIYAKAEYTFIDGRCYFSRERDLALRSGIRADRQRIIQAMIAAKQQGERTDKHISKEDDNYHCED